MGIHKRPLTYIEIPAPNDPIYAKLWPEIIGTKCHICTSHKAAPFWRIIDCPEGFCVMHKCDRGNYSYKENGGVCINPLHLKIGTRSENIKDCIKKKRFSFNNCPKQVVKIDRFTNEIIEKFDSMIEAQEKTGISFQNISGCCRFPNKRPFAGGFIWKFC